jgi:uracil-DNA glycosylase family 4
MQSYSNSCTQYLRSASRVDLKPEHEMGVLQHRIVHCTKCSRLVQWREAVVRKKTKRFIDQIYWGKPTPGFGDPDAGLLLVGLAPAAHGGNRTGRMFTGDRSGDWLFRALFKAGFASQPASIDRTDGLTLRQCYITAACRCAPPRNKLLPAELTNCRPYLLKEISLLANLRVVVGLGKVGFETAYSVLAEAGKVTNGPGKWKPTFGHGVLYRLDERLSLIGSYHPSQQNTFTGKLTEPMFDAIFERARAILINKF